MNSQYFGPLRPGTYRNWIYDGKVFTHCSKIWGVENLQIQNHTLYLWTTIEHDIVVCVNSCSTFDIELLGFINDKVVKRKYPSQEIKDMTDYKIYAEQEEIIILLRVAERIYSVIFLVECVKLLLHCSKESDTIIANASITSTHVNINGKTIMYKDHFHWLIVPVISLLNDYAQDEEINFNQPVKRRRL